MAETVLSFLVACWEWKYYTGVAGFYGIAREMAVWRGEIAIWREIVERLGRSTDRAAIRAGNA